MTMINEIGSLVHVLGANLLKTAGLSRNSVASPGLAVNTWVRQMRREDLPALRGHVALAAIRNSTWIEWIAYAACWARRLGYAPILVYSSSLLQKLYRGRGLRGFQRRVMAAGLWDAVERIPDVVLCDLDCQAQPRQEAIREYAAFAEDWAHTSSAYDLYVEEHEKGSLQGEYSRLVHEKQKLLARAGAQAEAIFRRLASQYKVNRLIAYSGLIDMTPALGEAARRVGWDRMFVEGYCMTPGGMICTQNAPALDWDPRIWLRSMHDWDEAESASMDRFVRYQETNDDMGVDWLVDHIKYQRASVTEGLDERSKVFLAGESPTFLMAPNVIADSGTMRRATIFHSQRQWITETCRFFREHPEWKLIIRAHPAEWRMRKKVRIKTGDIAEEAAAGAGNILIIPGDQDVSTYALIPHVQAGLIWLSNVGADMVIRDCPVVAVARAKYAGLGIATEPASRSEYFEMIPKLAQGPRCTTPQQKELAKKYISTLHLGRAFRAFSPTYRATGLHVTGQTGSDCERFYKVLVGDLPIETRPAAPDAGFDE